ncbi:hypothetical protein [Aeromonas sp. sia0103]|uniref:hypothetical protein n=1 Tax=Aeromonas sp. sia0103 TaxID=2854782 RepID=UPI001C450AC6|nr:hypothetical protein [Aeromonas sp. sia0103]MBV7599603.1 hypothetical protein [Aeromonas sp. sia0103]
MNKLIPLSLAAVFALTSGFTMAATATPATPATPATHATQTKVVKKHHHKAAHTAVAPTAKAKPTAATPKA